MHELSLAHGIVETACRALAATPDVRVAAVRLTAWGSVAVTASGGAGDTITCARPGAE